MVTFHIFIKKDEAQRHGISINDLRFMGPWAAVDYLEKFPADALLSRSEKDTAKYRSYAENAAYEMVSVSGN